jgi:flagellar biosynthesis protein FlhA
VLRPALRKFVPLPPSGVPVLSYAEVTSTEVAIETIGVVRGAAVRA